MTVTTQISAVTRCPHCAARFRVRAEQVKLHAGLVRCGACRGIFDAIEHLIEGSLPSADSMDDPSEGSPQTIIQGMPGMQPEDALDDTPSAASARAAVDAPNQATAATAATTSATDGVRVRNLDADTSEPADAAMMPPGALSNYRWRAQPRTSSALAHWVLGLLCVVAALALVAQAAFFFRDELASRVPASVPVLTAACSYLDCRVSPPKRGEQLGFIGTELVADPAHKGLLIFTATLRNSGATAVAYPHLILSLDGLSGELAVRRIFSPAEFAPATANLVRGLDAGAEVEIKLYLDASQTNVVGFKIDHAYL